MLISSAVLIMVVAADNLIVNPGFEKGLDGWKTSATGATIEQTMFDHRDAVHITVPPDAPIGWPMVYQETQAEPGQLIEATVEGTGQHVRDGYGAYASLEFLDASGQRINFEQSPAASGDGAWSQLVLHAVAPPKAATARLCLLLNGHGEAYFDNATLVRTDAPPARPLEGSVTLKVTEKVVCDGLIGFGAEDDGWFYNEENARHGVVMEDWAIREERIKWMDPDWVRMFFWYKDWSPSGDWETFTFDSPNMQSHYRTLDLYQKLGTCINVVGVEWGVNDPYGNPPRAARAIGALMEHLIRTKGYTCVQDWTLTNEPNGYFVGAGYSFDRFREMHRLVKEEFDRRGLKARIVGSDDTNGLTWFERCAKDNEYWGLASYFAAHRYINATSRELMPFFIEDRTRLLAQRTLKKAFMVAEFGFQDGRSGTLENPLMEEYGYAVWTSAFVIQGLNRGVAGFSIWCLHEVYYPGNGFMNYGLWNFKNRDWKVRPVYHAWAPFSQFTETGDRVFECISSHPEHVLGAVVNATLFWVNQGDRSAEVVLDGIAPKSVRIMTEGNLAGDRDCGEVQTLANGRFVAPPMSFGYAQ